MYVCKLYFSQKLQLKMTLISILLVFWQSKMKQQAMQWIDHLLDLQIAVFSICLKRGFSFVSSTKSDPYWQFLGTNLITLQNRNISLNTLAIGGTERKTNTSLHKYENIK